jgi:hypothetical protein
MKDYLVAENQRNRRNAPLYTEILRRCYGDTQVVVGHHVSFDATTEPNEIPSADTLLFDHEIMGRVFGERSIPIMRELASVPAEDRDMILKGHLENLKVEVK